MWDIPPPILTQNERSHLNEWARRERKTMLIFFLVVLCVAISLIVLAPSMSRSKEKAYNDPEYIAQAYIRALGKIATLSAENQELRASLAECLAGFEYTDTSHTEQYNKMSRL